MSVSLWKYQRSGWSSYLLLLHPGSAVRKLQAGQIQSYSQKRTTRLLMACKYHRLISYNGFRNLSNQNHLRCIPSRRPLTLWLQSQGCMCKSLIRLILLHIPQPSTAAYHKVRLQQYHVRLWMSVQMLHGQVSKPLHDVLLWTGSVPDYIWKKSFRNLHGHSLSNWSFRLQPYQDPVRSDRRLLPDIRYQQHRSLTDPS